jgi:hypothetical protein
MKTTTKTKTKKVVTLILAFLMMLSPCVFIFDVAAAETGEAPGESVNKCLRVDTGTGMWESVMISTHLWGLEVGKRYNISMRIHTPDKRVGLVFRRNDTFTWLGSNMHFLTPENKEWRTVSVTLDLTNASSVLSGFILGKRHDAPNSEEAVTFWIDDFIVTNADTGDVMFYEDFESGTHGSTFSQPDRSLVSVVDEPVNQVLRVVTGTSAQEGLYFSARDWGLETGKRYNISMRVRTPDKRIELALRRSDTAAWIDNDDMHFLTPENKEWRTVSYILDLTTGASVPDSFVLGKRPDRPNSDAVVTFWIDDFIVTDADTGEVIFYEGFESGRLHSNFSPFNGDSPVNRVSAVDEPKNQVLEVVTGTGIWDSVIISTAGWGLETGNLYYISMRIYTPDRPVGLVMRRSDTAAWTGDNMHFLTPETEEWREVGGVLDLRNEETVLSSLILGKRNDTANSDKAVTFLVDDFKVVKQDTGEIMYYQGFEGVWDNNISLNFSPESRLSLIEDPYVPPAADVKTRTEELEELIDEIKWRIIALEHDYKQLEQEIYNHRFRTDRKWDFLRGEYTEFVNIKTEIIDSFIASISSWWPSIYGLRTCIDGVDSGRVEGQTEARKIRPKFEAVEPFLEKNKPYVELEAELAECYFLLSSYEHELMTLLEESSEYELLEKQVNTAKLEYEYLRLKIMPYTDRTDYAERALIIINRVSGSLFADWDEIVKDPKAHSWRAGNVMNHYVPYRYFMDIFLETKDLGVSEKERMEEIEEFMSSEAVKRLQYLQLMEMIQMIGVYHNKIDEWRGHRHGIYMWRDQTVENMLNDSWFMENLDYNIADITEWAEVWRRNYEYAVRLFGHRTDEWAVEHIKDTFQYYQGYLTILAMFESVKESLNYIKEYSVKIVPAIVEFLEDYYEYLTWHRGFQEGIVAYENYLPFLTYPEIHYLYWAITGEMNKIDRHFGPMEDQERWWLMRDRIMALERYLTAAAVIKHQEGELLTAYELYWFNEYMRWRNVSVGQISEEEFFASLPYYMIVGSLSLVEHLVGFFEVVAGTANVLYNGRPMKLFDAFFLNPVVSYAFWGLTVIGLALLIFIAIGSISKRALSLGAEKSIGATLGQIGRSALTFLLAPIVMLAAIQLVALVMEQTDRAFDQANGASSVSRAVFTMSTLEAGKGEVIGNMNSPERRKFMTGEYDYKDKNTVGRYFNIDELDMLLSLLLAGILIIMYIALICIFILRIFYLMLLYIACPLFIPSLAAGDGAMFRKWRELFIAKLCTGFGLVISVKLLIYILPVILLGDIKLGPEGFGDVFVKFIFVIGSVFSVTKSSGVLASIIYPDGDSTEDMVFGAMKEKALYVANKVRKAVEEGIKMAFNVAKLAVTGDATGLVKQAADKAAETAKKAADAAGKIAKSATQEKK